MTTTTTTEPPQPLVRKGWDLTTANVGITPFATCSSLQLYTDAAKPARGAVIENKLIEKGLDLSNGDIVIRKSCIAPRNTMLLNALVTTIVDRGNGDCCHNGLPAGAAPPTIEDSDISGLNLSAATVDTSCAVDGVFNLYRNRIYGMGSGICLRETGDTVSAMVQNNYVHNLRRPANGQAHHESATVRDFQHNASVNRSVTFDGNRLHTELTGGFETASLFIQPTWVQVAHVWVKNNYLEGKAYNLVLEQAAGGNLDTHAVNNRFRQPVGCDSSAGCYGYASRSGTPGWTEWNANYAYNSIAVDAKGAIVSAP